jgi:hypothetical protein
MSKKPKEQDAPKGTGPEPGQEVKTQPEANEKPKAKPRSISLEEMRKKGYVLGERTEGDVVHVVTKGGQKLTFPGDEEKAGAMEKWELDGTPGQAPSRNILLGK